MSLLPSSVQPFVGPPLKDLHPLAYTLWKTDILSQASSRDVVDKMYLELDQVEHSERNVVDPTLSETNRDDVSNPTGPEMESGTTPVTTTVIALMAALIVWVAMTRLPLLLVRLFQPDSALLCDVFASLPHDPMLIAGTTLAPTTVEPGDHFPPPVDAGDHVFAEVPSTEWVFHCSHAVPSIFLLRRRKHRWFYNVYQYVWTVSIPIPHSKLSKVKAFSPSMRAFATVKATPVTRRYLCRDSRRHLCPFYGSDMCEITTTLADVLRAPNNAMGLYLQDQVRVLDRPAPWGAKHLRGQLCEPYAYAKSKRSPFDSSAVFRAASYLALLHSNVKARFYRRVSYELFRTDAMSIFKPDVGELRHSPPMDISTLLSDDAKEYEKLGRIIKSKYNTKLGWLSPTPTPPRKTP
ncbi:hypothetical protein H257_12271 [Aphanomyces astaci]|uniref:Uncharacterized protein n=1 Tax=Aphanomyces astaci TaxID=112090 RepID=W4FZP1_APHAT|nr:hypothetical protein H257_12271 [Aphanomyces astaci]ETV72940.1 hypothetical protein H257_12271 [Aphanomyces astaci]|eukprot:XP_009837726.1 hypothetical protein H257_12271 [Aphanomyces astaci]